MTSVIPAAYFSFILYSRALTSSKLTIMPGLLERNMSSFPPRCYYCDSKNFGSVDGYERHVVFRHPNLPGYQGPADIKYYRLEKQDMSWEREIKADNGDKSE